HPFAQRLDGLGLLVDRVREILFRQQLLGTLHGPAGPAQRIPRRLGPFCAAFGDAPRFALQIGLQVLLPLLQAFGTGLAGLPPGFGFLALALILRLLLVVLLFLLAVLLAGVLFARLF